MADVVIRGLSDAVVARIDADATAQGLSRQEYLRRRFEAERSAAHQPVDSRSLICDARLPQPAILAISM